MNTYAFSAYKAAAKRRPRLVPRVSRMIRRTIPVGDLVLRLWVANAFWVSAITKVQSWDSTLYLFQEEYAVPLLPPELAAYLGTGVELAAPVLLAFGVLGRLAAAVLFLFNIAAVISYPDLGPAGLEQHRVWGVMLLVCWLHGPGRWSADRLWARHHSRRARARIPDADV